MKEIEFELESMCPLKMDRFVDGIQPKTDAEYQKQALEKCYRTSKGEIGIPACAVKAAIREASSDLGKKMEAKKRRQLIRALLFVEPEFLSIGKKDFDCIDKSIVTRGYGSKVTRVPSYRPLIKNWKCKGKMHLVDGLTPDFVKQCFDLAGIKFGILSHRPDFGRYS